MGTLSTIYPIKHKREAVRGTSLALSSTDLHPEEEDGNDEDS